MSNETQEIIPTSDLVAFEDFVGAHPVRVDLVYAKPAHRDNMFGVGIYRAGARMLAHRDMATLVLRAAAICFAQSGYIFELKDCLRTVEAQALMMDTDIVKAHPHWTEEPNRLLSPPGRGGHPRGMAVDIVLIDKNGDEVDMGTRFDFLTEDRNNNPAARNYTGFSTQVLENRRLLEDCMMQAAAEAGRELLPLPQEWWDFRFPNSYTSRFAPIRDADLPRELRMTAL